MSDGFTTRSDALYIAVEDEYGVAETLAGGDAIEAEEIAFNPTQLMTVIERNVARPNLNPEQALIIKGLRGITFNAELKGSGSAGTAPIIGRLLRACGWTETIVASTSVTYAPDSDITEHDSITIGYRRGPNLRVLSGCRGSVSFSIPARGRGMASFTFIGHGASDAAAAAPTPSYESTKPRAFIGADFQIGGDPYPINELTLDQATTPNPADDPNSDFGDGYGIVRVTGWNFQGSANPEDRSIDTKDWLGLLEAGTLQDIQTGVIGSVEGNRWAMNMDNCYFRDLSEEERDFLATVGLQFGMVNPDADLSLQFT